MKKSIAIFLIAAIVGGTMHLDEMVKITFLFSHYKEHKLLHPEDSVSGFLYKHYILNQAAESQADKSQHAKLPFKSSKAFLAHFIPFVFQSNSEDIILLVSTNDFEFFTLKEVCTGPFDIWLPPKS